MKVLITGSSRRLGGAIAQQLASSHQVLGIDLVPGITTSVVGDITDRYLAAELVRQVHAVIHTVSLHAPDLSRRSAADFRRVNVEATHALLESAAGAKHHRVIYTSTTSVYGHSLEAVDRAVWVTEDLPVKPRDVYDETKLAAEELCRAFAEREGLSVICLRVARYFRQSPEVMAGYRLHRGVDVRDAAAAHVLALDADDVPFGIFNVSARSPFACSDAEALYRDAPAVIGRYFPSAQRAFAEHGWRLPARIDRVYAIDRAAQVLGYDPRHNFAELLAGEMRELDVSSI